MSEVPLYDLEASRLEQVITCTVHSINIACPATRDVSRTLYRGYSTLRTRTAPRVFRRRHAPAVGPYIWGGVCSFIYLFIRILGLYPEQSLLGRMSGLVSQGP